MCVWKTQVQTGYGLMCSDLNTHTLEGRMCSGCLAVSKLVCCAFRQLAFLGTMAVMFILWLSCVVALGCYSKAVPVRALVFLDFLPFWGFMTKVESFLSSWHVQGFLAALIIHAHQPKPISSQRKRKKIWSTERAVYSFTYPCNHFLLR